MEGGQLPPSRSAVTSLQPGYRMGSSKFHISGARMKHTVHKWFAVDADVKQAVSSWIQTLYTDLFYAGI
jgi:hypothetical protein